LYSSLALFRGSGNAKGVACLWEMRNLNADLYGYPEGERPLEEVGWDDGIKACLSRRSA
jgi:hypothetical protein